MSVLVAGLTKAYPSRRRDAAPVLALAGVDLDVGDEVLLVVVGPSGSGKSTLLRCIAGLEQADTGRIEVGGRDVTGEPPGSRDVAMVFQEYALYPHLTVEGNISFGLRARKQGSDEVARRTTEAAAILALEDVMTRRPRELSGGERQRVALARAVVREPKAFLLDEPLSNLDAELRTHTRAEIKALQRRLTTTTVYVTHDQVEAMTMGDRVAVLRGGRVEQVAAPMTLYDRPANGFVARFLGSPPMNLVAPGALGLRGNGAGVAGVRPERITLVDTGSGRATGQIVLVESVGNGAIVHVDIGTERLLVRTPWTDAPRQGAEAGLSFADHDVHMFESHDGPALT